jgi:hypothetical protein
MRLLLIATLFIASQASANVLGVYTMPDSYARWVEGKQDHSLYPDALPEVRFVIEKIDNKILISQLDPMTVVLLNEGIGLQHTNYPLTTKAQILGLLTQLENLMNNDQDTAKALRSVSNLYDKREEVLHELGVIRAIVNKTN